MVGANVTNIDGAGRPQNQAQECWPEQQVRLSDSDRLEAFSDGVFSITITLLAFEIVRPEHEPGRLLNKLLAQWPTYIAFLASFFYVGVIWLNHHSMFARVRYCDRHLHWANLLVLLTTALIPFPTAVLSTALMHGSQVDAQVAVALYAGLGALMCCAWLYSFHLLSTRPYLLESDVPRTFFPKERWRALAGIGAYLFAGLIGWTLSPRLALMILLGLPIFFAVTSNGLLETNIRWPRTIRR
jgi:uncharacterized membrane protein